MELYRVRDACIERDTSGLSPSGLAPRQVKPAHFTVEIGPLDAKYLCGVSDPPVVVLEDGSYVVALKPSSGVSERCIDAYRTDASLDLGMRQNIFEPD